MYRGHRSHATKLITEAPQGTARTRSDKTARSLKDSGVAGILNRIKISTRGPREIPQLRDSILIRSVKLRNYASSGRLAETRFDERFGDRGKSSLRLRDDRGRNRPASGTFGRRRGPLPLPLVTLFLPFVPPRLHLDKRVTAAARDALS